MNLHIQILLKRLGWISLVAAVPCMAAWPAFAAGPTAVEVPAPAGAGRVPRSFDCLIEPRQVVELRGAGFVAEAARDHRVEVTEGAKRRWRDERRRFLGRPFPYLSTVCPRHPCWSCRTSFPA